MQYKNEVPEKMKLALAVMLYSTCGEDEETLAGTEITMIGPNIFHITYALDNPYEAMNFQVAIDVWKDSLGNECKFHYTIFRSMFGDDGDFFIEVK